MTALRVAQVLGEAYDAAPIGWLRSYGRINNVVRNRMHLGGREALGRLEAIPEAERPPTYWGAEQAVSGMVRVASGVDPRGGTERDQMCSAMDRVAREMARALAYTKEPS